MSVKRLGNKKYEIRGSVPTSTGKYHYYFFRKSFNSINEAREYELKYKESFNIENHMIENHWKGMNYRYLCQERKYLNMVRNL